ncbi:hypothetical protein CLV78_108152 [Aliiruegeria haliotis]|uniref:Uncharacterized protein n=1 Tax=Aliiruegeria haliotis TaxID=1280846 RepID=A0A2T0RL79_9RHOB|nr:hypothetical protein CLV78_108152 [Aliiruegeria haliotis]
MEHPQTSLSSKLRFDCRGADGRKWRVRRKIHLGIDEETLGVRAVEVTGSSVGLPSWFGSKPLLDRGFIA